MKYHFLKVARDRCIKGWKFPEGDFGIEYGSGYPNGKLHQIVGKRYCKTDRSLVMEPCSLHLPQSDCVTIVTHCCNYRLRFDP